MTTNPLDPSVIETKRLLLLSKFWRSEEIFKNVKPPVSPICSVRLSRLDWENAFGSPNWWQLCGKSPVCEMVELWDIRSNSDDIIAISETDYGQNTQIAYSEHVDSIRQNPSVKMVIFQKRENIDRNALITNLAAFLQILGISAHVDPS
jgi:hypothetical protein